MSRLTDNDGSKICPICDLTIEKSIRSHLMPKWTIAKDKSDVRFGDFGRETIRKRHGSGLPYEDGLICEDCEVESSMYDTYAAEFFRKKADGTYDCTTIDLEKDPVFIFDFDTVKIKKFVLWVFLRVYFSREFKAEFNRVDLKHIQYCKDFVRGGYSAERLEYITFIRVDVEIYSRGLSFPTFPRMRRDAGAWACEFDIGPFRFIQSLASHPSRRALAVSKYKFSYLNPSNTKTCVFSFKGNLAGLLRRLKKLKPLGRLKKELK